jgi:hypothetical protein
MIRRHFGLVLAFAAVSIGGAVSFWLVRPSRIAAASETASYDDATPYCTRMGELYSLGAFIYGPSGGLTCTVEGWADIKGTIEFPSQSKVRVGAQIPSVYGVDAKNFAHLIKLAGSSRPTVLYFYASGSPWCERNRDNLETLARSVGAQYSIVALSLTEMMPQDDPAGGAKVLVYSLASPTLETLGLHAAPETVVVSPNGTVLKEWVGAYTEEVLGSVEKYFGVRLQGTSE